MFIDSVTLTLSAGKGGNGVVAWRREKYIPKGGPAGGDGGNGGSIILQSNAQVLSLQDFRNRRILNAESGQPGGSGNKQGRSGKDLIVHVPCGTLVKDAETKEVILDLTQDKQTWKICQGGRGGKGNSRFRTPTHQAPFVCTEGTFGQSRSIELELKLIADVGLIGMPNAGKSTLMSQITHVPVKIAPYPFTTLIPNLSYIECEDYTRILFADIPGIIADAHKDRGLGLSFLKHIERTSMLIFVIDSTGFEERDPLEDFELLRRELKAYNEELLAKPFLVALNKIDGEGSLENCKRFRERYPNLRTFEISALQNQGLAPLIEASRQIRVLSKSSF